MLASFRRLSKSTVGSIVLVLFVLAIVASFALADISNIVSPGAGGQTGELARVGSETITERDMDRAMQRRLAEVQQQNPEASYADIAGDFERVLAALIDERALQAFGRKHGFILSKRLIDAEIASIPAARGLDGRFSEQAYQNFLAQQRLTDQEVRSAIANQMLQRMLLAPVAANARVPVGMARPYASMLLETREGQVAFVPVAAFREGLNPTPEQVQQFYAANQARYTVPEQRVLRIARIGPEQVANIQATEQEIGAQYQQNRAQYAPREIRVISQAVVPDQATAQQIAARARSGASFVEAAAPAGLGAEDVSVGPQTREEFSRLAGDAVAAAAFSAAEGAIVGPVQSDLGWHVVKIDDVRTEGGRTLAQVRGEIAEQITARKRQDALADMIGRIEDAIAGGASFNEAIRGLDLPVIETPLITAGGVARDNPDYRLPEELAPAVKTGFELSENEDPVVETLPNDAGYTLVAAERIVQAAPAPLESIREQVRQDWITTQATGRAQAVANAVAERAAAAPLDQAVQGAGAQIPPVAPVTARRLQLAQFQGRVPPALGLLFSMGEGKARMVPGSEGEGFYVVKVNKITPGNALNQPGLITSTQQQLQQALSEEYARQFLQSVRNAVDVRRNEDRIARAKQRIASGG